jgi:hypothetical protein
VFETVLGTPTGPQPLLLTLGEMPAHDADTVTSLQAIADDAEMRELHILEDNSNRAVLKGRGNKNTDPNEAVNLFLRKAKRKGDKHFSKVVKAVKVFLSARGFSNFVMRLHLNWVPARSRFSFEHGLHADAWKCALLEQEKKTARVVAVVGLKYSQEQWDAFRTQVQSLHHVTPQMPGSDGPNFVALVGKVLYPWPLFISSGAQIAIAKKKRKDYRKLLVVAGASAEESEESEEEQDDGDE